MIDELIRKHEGCKLDAYPDPKTGGLPITIGFGSTKKADGTNWALGDTISQDMADALLNNYLIKEVFPVIDGMGCKFTQRQKAALASLIYNWNAKGFKNSKLYQAILDKNWAEVCRQWDYGFKNNLKGIYKRRTEELSWFIQDI